MREALRELAEKIARSRIDLLRESTGIVLSSSVPSQKIAGLQIRKATPIDRTATANQSRASAVADHAEVADGWLT